VQMEIGAATMPGDGWWQTTRAEKRRREQRVGEGQGVAAHAERVGSPWAEVRPKGRAGSTYPAASSTVGRLGRLGRESVGEYLLGMLGWVSG
jgi:hypothetical protein